MASFFTKTNPLLKKLFSNYIWDLPNNEKKVFLTFDDGPTPEITDWVLEQLEKHNAKATFFCIGANIEKHPRILKRIIGAGHAIGNHTFNHLEGWRTTDQNYVENTTVCAAEINKYASKDILLFRPPYGKIKPSQSKKLRQKGYKIIMWDVLSWDFDASCTPEKCLENVLKHTSSGSIIVFHDSIKAFHNLRYVLPKVMDNLSQKGFVFEKIS